jgi:Holliday junction resolvase RusA-like endonuclease
MTDEVVYVTVEPWSEPQSAKLRRGDIDNYTKLICDALNGIAWRDDRQIAALTVRKL